MTDPRHHPEPAGRDRSAHRLSAVALLTALTFGCTTVRQPVSLIQGPVQVRDGVVDPQLELWLESARPVTPEESAAATAAAREALADALRGRRIADGSMLLVVREQGVSRTGSHRRDQAAATAGIVLGAVVVVVAAVVLVVLSSKSGSGGHAPARPAGPAWRGAQAAGAAPAVSPALPVAAAAARGAPVRPPPVRPPSARPPPARPPPVRPGPVVHDHAPAVAVGVSVGPGPITWEPGPPPPAPALGPSPEAWPAVPVGPEVAGAPAEAPAETPAEVLAGLTEVALPDLPPYPIDERDFLAGDALVLEFTLVDEATGAPRWMKRVSAKADPCDREEVRRVVDRALDEAAGWIEVR